MEENSIMLLKKNIIKIEKNNKENKSIIKFWEGNELDLFSINKNNTLNIQIQKCHYIVFFF